VDKAFFTLANEIKSKIAKDEAPRITGPTNKRIKQGEDLNKKKT